MISLHLNLKQIFGILIMLRNYSQSWAYYRCQSEPRSCNIIGGQ